MQEFLRDVLDRINTVREQQRSLNTLVMRLKTEEQMLERAVIAAVKPLAKDHKDGSGSLTFRCDGKAYRLRECCSSFGVDPISDIPGVDPSTTVEYKGMPSEVGEFREKTNAACASILAQSSASDSTTSAPSPAPAD